MASGDWKQLSTNSSDDRISKKEEKVKAVTKKLSNFL